MNNYVLFEGDCLEEMAHIADGSVDMILCDLPYGVTENSWDKVIPFDPLWKHYKRVCKRNAAIVLFSQMPFMVDLVNSNRREFRYEWIYEKTNRAGFLNAKKMPLKVHENILVFYEALPTYNPQFTQGEPYFKSGITYSANYGNPASFRETKSPDGRRYPVDLIKFNNVQSSWGRANSDIFGHPTVKPVSLCEYLIRTYTNEGETVLDNCMGSGSTGVACMNTNRKFVGIELMPEYFVTAKKRIEEAANEARLKLPFGE